MGWESIIEIQICSICVSGLLVSQIATQARSLDVNPWCPQGAV